MTDFIGKFITGMVNAGIVPKSTKITQSDTFKRIAAEHDKGGKRSISYWLRLDYDFAYGYVRDFKTGAEYRFNSTRDDPNMTRADIARVKALLKVRKAEEDIRIADRHKKISLRAKVKWNLAKAHGTTPYLDKKELPLLSARIYGTKSLFIPVYEQGSEPEMVSWQIIEADGTKKFPFGGKKKGCFHIIGQINPAKPILICEGWATGASLHLALNTSVVVALDAGNMLAVAKVMRSVYKSPIIIAADNDEKSRTGQNAAANVIKKVPDCTAIICPQTDKDFDDLSPEEIRLSFGVKEDGGGIPPDGLQSTGLPAAGSSAADPSWMDSLIMDVKGRIQSASLQNAIMYMMFHQDFKGCFAYDEFRQDTLLVKCPPWENESRFQVSSITDIHITQAAATLERYGISCTIDKTSKAIDVVADENKFHSAREYFNILEWDGCLRLETFLKDYAGVTEESEEYLAFVFQKWMTAAVKRIMEPGCKFDHVLILEGQKQGLYKSELLKSLATFEGERYHTESVSMSDLANKDTVMKMQGNLIIELAELSGFNKKDDNAIKNWITQTIDEVRIPFARKTVCYPRQFVFAATTNNYDYLKDPTGNRRYWPVTIKKTIDLAEVEKIKSQLWAEAVYWYKDGLYIGPTPEEDDLANYERGKRIQPDAWEDKILGIINYLPEFFRVSDILEKMDLRTNEKNEGAQRRITTVLRQNAFNNAPRWDSELKKNVRVWSR